MGNKVIMNAETGEVQEVQETTAGLSVLESDEGIRGELVSATNAYCSMIADTPEAKAKMFHCINSPDKRLKDCVNMTIALRDVYAETVHLAQEDGSTEACPRIVLIDDKGVGYQCVSFGVFSAIKKLFSIFGTPDVWEKPIKVTVKQINRGNNRNPLTLDIVM